MMKKMNTYTYWLKIGYDLFGLEGDEGIQVERLARILQLNKSGFYHYFGTKEIYLEQLMNYHLQIADNIKLEIQAANSFDPDFLQIMVKNKEYLQVQMQLFLNKRSVLFRETFITAAAKCYGDILPLWADYLGLQNNPEFVEKYFKMTRSVFFTQITPKNLNLSHLQNLAQESKSLAEMMIRENNLLSKSLIL